MKFILASLILFLGMYALAAAEQDDFELILKQSTCEIVDAKGQPIPSRCDGFAHPKKEDSKGILSLTEDEETEIE